MTETLAAIKAPIAPSTADRLLAAHGDHLYSLALARLRDPLAAEEVLQDTLLTALKTRSRRDLSTGERAWLVGLLREKLIDRLQDLVPNFTGTDDHLETRFFDENGQWRSGCEPKEWLGKPEVPHSAVLAAIAKLPADLAAIYSLREIEGLDPHELCRMLGISQTRCFDMLHKARLLVRHEAQSAIERRDQ